MNNIDNGSPDKNTVPMQTPIQTTGSMRRLLAEDPSRRPVRGGAGQVWMRFVVPTILVLTLVIGVGILAYSFGVSRGKGNSNSERDQFLEARAASWNATATAQASGASGGGDTTAAIVPQNSFNVSTSVYARVDKIDGAKITVLLLSSAGQPSGNTVTLNIISGKTQVWRNVPSQTVQLTVGDTILFAGTLNGTNTYNADTVVVLAASS
jgi:hypothetical protein